jgi:hypothetical protein
LQAQLVAPYLVIFSVAVVLSAVTLVVKGKLFLEGLRSLNANAGPITLDGVDVSAELAQLAPIVEIQQKFEDNSRARKKLYCSAALLVIEGKCVVLVLRQSLCITRHHCSLVTSIPAMS